MQADRVESHMAASTFDIVRVHREQLGNVLPSVSVSLAGNTATSGGGGGMCSPSSLWTTQKPRFTGLVHCGCEFFVRKTAMPSKPPRPFSCRPVASSQSSLPP